MINVKPGFAGRLCAAATKENLLLLNAILCFFYASCYMLLILLSFSEDRLNSRPYATAVIILNILFLTVLGLTLNTIQILYRQIARPVKWYMRIVYVLTFAAWSYHVLLSYWSNLFAPGFLTHFHQYIQFTFRVFSWQRALLFLIFSIGFSLLFAAYYRELKMKQVLFFIIPAIFQFSFKVMFPFFFFMMGWVFFGGCQLLLYYSILDSRPYSLAVDRELAMG